MTSISQPAKFIRGLLCACVIGAAPLGAAEPQDGPGRFTAALADGARLTGKDVGPWYDTNSQPKLGGKHLFDPDNPVRWLCDNSLPTVGRPEAFVEFYGGDRLPGRALLHAREGDSPYDAAPDHLVVKPLSSVDWPTAPRESVRVAARWLRRVVWKRQFSDRYEPGTVFCLDGRRLKFRSLRFVASSVRLLLDDGTASLEFSQLAELHMPRLDPWQCYFEQLATLSPDCSARMLRMETDDGLRLTTSTERFRASHHGSHNPDHWYHIAQPAWSLDPLWIGFQTIRQWRYWEPGRPPLSGLEVAGATEDSGDGSHWPWRLDRNARGGPLRCAGLSFGWGFGSHAPYKMEIRLPACARRLHVRLGLDEVVGQGGCARAIVRLDADSRQTLYRSEPIIGSMRLHDPGPIALPPANGDAPRTLSLIADPAHTARPPGADPLNIRDTLDWIEPELELDLSALRREVRQCALRAIPAFEGWAPQATDGEAWDISSRWDETQRTAPAYRLLMAPREPFTSVSRTLMKSDRHNWLALVASRFGDDAPARIQVELDGHPRGVWDVPPKSSSGDPNPILIPLEDGRRGEVSIKITPLPLGPRSWVDWRQVLLLEHPPGALKLFDEEAEFVSLLSVGDGKASLERDDRHTGKVCLRITSPSCAAEHLDGLPVEIRERPKLGQFRYLRFAWKLQGAETVTLSLGHDGQFGPALPDMPARQCYRYRGGRKSVDGAAQQLNGPAPDKWIGYTRDLYADFGEFTLTGLSFGAGDTGDALFDDLHLVRTLGDLPK